MKPTKSLAADKTAESLFDGLPVAVICFDADDRIIHANAEAESIFSQTFETMMSVDVATLMPFTPALPALLARCRREFARVTQAGIILHGMSFEPVEADAIAAPYPAAGDNAVVIALFTHRRGRELAHVSELDAAMRSVAGMAGVLSHEIKNPLAGISRCGAASSCAAYRRPSANLRN